MRHGITMFVTDETIDVVSLARAVEERGFDSLYVPEHTHIPVSRRTPPPTGEDTLAREYHRCLDPLVAMAAAAAVTERIRVGTGICLVAQRDPIVTAKAVASLDLVARGRFVFGVGFGWNEDEMEHHGVHYATRRARAREHVLAMQRLWVHDEAEWHGQWVDFSASWSWPKPVQRPGPPVLVGGAAGPKLFSHVVEYADGWIPIGGAGLTKAIPELRSRWEDAGRDPSALDVVPFGSVPDPAKLEHFAAIGVTEVVSRVPPVPGDDALRALDEIAALIHP